MPFRWVSGVEVSWPQAAFAVCNELVEVRPEGVLAGRLNSKARVRRGSFVRRAGGVGFDRMVQRASQVVAASCLQPELFGRGEYYLVSLLGPFFDRFSSWFL